MKALGKIRSNPFDIEKDGTASSGSIIGTANEIIVTDSGAGSVTLSLAAAVFGSPPAIGATLAGTIRALVDEDVEPATDTLTANQCSGGLINNYGQSADVTLTLPAAAAGYNFTVVLGTTVAKFFLLHPNSADYIYLDGVLGAVHKGVQVASAAAGNAIQFIAFNTGGASTYYWHCTIISGPWIVES